MCIRDSPRMDRRHPADGARRSHAVLDPRGHGVQGRARQARGHAGVRRRAGRDRAEGSLGAMVPDDVARAWGWAPADIAELSGGLLNATYAVRPGGEPVAVLQRLHAIFAAEVNLDPVSYTHLRAHETPEHLVCRLLLEK